MLAFQVSAAYRVYDADAEKPAAVQVRCQKDGIFTWTAQQS